MLNYDFLSKCKTLIEGLWDKDLPPIFNHPSNAGYFNVLNNISNKERYDLFTFHNSDETFVSGIKDFKIRNGAPYGTEIAKFYSYKNNNSLRQMGMVNPLLYLGFVYNTVSLKDSFFTNIYLESTYYSCSLSPIFVDNGFYIIEDFYQEYEDEDFDFLVNIFGFEHKKERTKKEEKNYLYSLKVDISNFYSNIYTHHLERIGKRYNTFELPPTSLENVYFSFLDKFSQRTNLSQTKGIFPGPFSSTLCAELFMNEIDKRIEKDLIKDKSIGYLRNVDDMTFYSDSKEELSTLLDKLQMLLFEYELSINENKTLIEKCALEYEEDLKDEIEISAKNYCENGGSLDALEALKATIAKAVIGNKKSLSKAILSKIKGFMESNDCEIENPSYSINYFYKLALTEKYLGSRCFKIIDAIMSRNEGTPIQLEIVDDMLSKTELINSSYNSSIIQVWHYYIISKYGIDFQKEEAFDLYNKQVKKKSPFVLMSFIKKGNGMNKNLFNIAKTQTNLSSGKLFLTCFSPLLMSIYSVDKENYDGYLDDTPRIIFDLYDSQQPSEDEERF